MSTGATGPQGEQGETGATGATGKDGAHEPVTKIFVVLIVSCFVVIGIGVQAYLSDRAAQKERLEDERHDARIETCTQEWADEMRSTITLARSFTLELEKALTRRNDAIDEILLDVALRPIGAEPTQAELEDFRADLDEFIAAKDNLDMVKAETDINRASNPYPVFNPNCAAGATAAEKVN